MKIKIGMDIEFMAMKNGRWLYPVLTKELKGIGCDEFGHCVEIRPAASIEKQDLIFNIMKEMAKLPAKIQYIAHNAIWIPETDFNDLLRAQGRKDVPGCKNVYGGDILKQSKFEKDALEQDRKVVYCGMHVHVSTADELRIATACKKCSEEIKERREYGIPIPYRILTRLFDRYLYEALKEDKSFNVGRYRSPGFYEVKNESHFEYRSLGVSAFTPKRVSIIFDMVKYIVGNYDRLCHIEYDELAKELFEMEGALKKTKAFQGDLKKLWVKWV